MGGTLSRPKAKQPAYHDGDRRAFLATPISEFLPHRDLVSLPHSATLGEALEAFRKYDISSAPVALVENAVDATEFELLDIADLVAALDSFLGRAEPNSLTPELRDKIWSIPLASIKPRAPTMRILDSASVESVIAQMRQSRTYRMLVATELDGHLRHVVTQSSILRFVRQNLDHLHPKPDHTLAALSFYGSPPPILSAKTSTRVLDALRDMMLYGFTAAPLIDELGVMRHFLSVRDARVVTKDTLEDLFLPASAFLDKYRPKYPKHSLDETLIGLVEVFIEKNHHHAFFCDENGGPIGVITLTDILDLVWRGGFEENAFLRENMCDD